jgi:hydrogenase-4 component B
MRREGVFEPASELIRLFWLTCALFGFSFLTGTVAPALGKALPVDGEKVKTWAMQVALGLAFLGAVVVTLAAGWFLASGCSFVDGATCDLDATVWSGLSLEFDGLTPPPDHLASPSLGLTLYVDPLAAVFALLVGFFTACVALYSLGWLARDPERHSVAGNFSLFAVATLLVLVVNNAFWLLLILELMTLSFGYLVLYRGRRGGSPDESRTAVRTYLIVSHLSIVCLATSVLIVGSGHQSFDLKDFRDPFSIEMPPVAIHLAFLFALVGLGIRAGTTPFHFWVPVVHPQSPTTTHAFSLGVSIKVAIYLMIRFFFEFLGPVAWWWGALILVLAGVTALVNVFYAVLSPDLKQALAYHSVENIGIILAGLGLALLFASVESPKDSTVRSVAGLALMAGLFHTFNHALFKGLLYLGTGSIENRTGTVVMGRLGGCLQRFPWTGIAFLVGAVAIAGFPPFNGFVSEWLIVQALFAGMDVYRHSRLVPVLMAVLLFTLILLATSFAMTALAFVKIAGETLLGLPRDPEVVANEARGEVPWSMRGVLVLLAALCLVLGLFPGLVVPWLGLAVGHLGHESTVLQSALSGLTIQVTGNDRLVYTATLSLLPLMTLVILPLLAVLAANRWRALVPPRYSAIWSGGERYLPQTMQHTGGAFSALIWEFLAQPASPPSPKGSLPATFILAERRYVPEGFNRLYNNLFDVLLRISTGVGRGLQNGDIRRYLMYIFATFVAVLILLAFTGEAAQ